MLKRLLGIGLASFFTGVISLLAQTNFVQLVPDGAWTWFNDPRAIFNNGNLYFGYVRDSDGSSCLNMFNLRSGQTTNLWVSSRKETDDHDVCGLLTKQDGTMLAIYSRHQTDQFFTYRLSTTTNLVAPADWGPEHTNTTPFASQGMTYSNPYQLTNEAGKIYNFARNQNYNPCVFSSTDGGSNWTPAQIVIKTGTGSTRPYVKYCSDYNSRIDLIYTDAHPDNQPTSLYHTYYQNGAFYQTDGTFLKSYANLPILHDSGERGTYVYQYNTNSQPDPNQWIPFGRVWGWEIAYQTNGAPVCVFQAKVDNVTGPNWFDARIYYYYARWTGTNWQKRFVAQAGRPLYNGQPDYGGGMALDPLDPNTIYISTDAANPFDLTTTTSVPLTNNYEIWKGTTTDGGLTFTWQPITGNSTVDNLRPYIPRRFGGEPCVLWFRGTYTSYTSFNTAVVGLFTTAVPVITNSTSTGLPVPAAIPPAQIERANNTTPLSQGASWVGGNAPGTGNVAVWDNTVTAANSVALGANASWAGILVANPGGTVNITSGNTLMLGASGIDMSGATANLTISSGLTITGYEIWNLASGRTLTLNTGAFIRSNGATLNIQGAGTVTSSMAGFNSTDATVPPPGIIGPWATTGSGTSTHYAAMNTGNIVAYTGLSSPFNWSTAVPNFTNFEISAVSAAIGIDRMCNTIRWTGGIATEDYGSGSSANRLFVRGILNAGTGTLTFVKASGTPTFIPGTNSTSSNPELVLNAAAAGLVMGVPIADNAGSASSVVITGSVTNTVILNAGNTYTGGTTLNGGELILGNAGGLGSSSGALTVNGGTLDLGGFSPVVGAVTINGGVIQDGTLTANSFVANNPNSAGVSVVLAGVSAPLTKSGSGMLSLTAQNTYSGITTVSAGTLNLLGGISGPVNVASGTLNGNGTISGAVTNESGSTMAPGADADTIGTLTIDNSLVLQPGSTMVIKVSKNGDGIVNDSVVGLTAVTYGGTLTVTNIGADVLAVGDSIQIFSAASYRGAFASVLPSTPGTGLVWNTNNLTLNGILSVAPGNVSPQFDAIRLSGTNLIVNGHGGTAAADYSIFTSTNLALPLSEWSLLQTATFDDNGNFSFTNAIQVPAPARFYEITIP
jgi:autotransporter-associated beta strand protein